jgi:hypothetical protein
MHTMYWAPRPSSQRVMAMDSFVEQTRHEADATSRGSAAARRGARAAP